MIEINASQRHSLKPILQKNEGEIRINDCYYKEIFDSVREGDRRNIVPIQGADGELCKIAIYPILNTKPYDTLIDQNTRENTQEYAPLPKETRDEYRKRKVADWNQWYESESKKQKTDPCDTTQKVRRSVHYR